MRAPYIFINNINNWKKKTVFLTFIITYEHNNAKSLYLNLIHDLV